MKTGIILGLIGWCMSIGTAVAQTDPFFIEAPSSDIPQDVAEETSPNLPQISAVKPPDCVIVAILIAQSGNEQWTSMRCGSRSWDLQTGDTLHISDSGLITLVDTQVNAPAQSLSRIAELEKWRVESITYAQGVVLTQTNLSGIENQRHKLQVGDQWQRQR